MRTSPARDLIKSLHDRNFVHLFRGELVLKNEQGETFPLRSVVELMPGQVEDGAEYVDPLYDVRKRVKDLTKAGVGRDKIALLLEELMSEPTGENPAPNPTVEADTDPESLKELGAETAGTLFAGLDAAMSGMGITPVKFGELESDFAGSEPQEEETIGSQGPGSQTVLSGEANDGEGVQTPQPKGQASTYTEEESGTGGETPALVRGINGATVATIPGGGSGVRGRK